MAQVWLKGVDALRGGFSALWTSSLQVKMAALCLDGRGDGLFFLQLIKEKKKPRQPFLTANSQICLSLWLTPAPPATGVMTRASFFLFFFVFVSKSCNQLEQKRRRESAVVQDLNLLGPDGLFVTFKKQFDFDASFFFSTLMIRRA